MLRPGSGAAGGAEDERFPLFSNHSTKLKMVEGFMRRVAQSPIPPFGPVVLKDF